MLSFPYLTLGSVSICVKPNRYVIPELLDTASSQKNLFPWNYKYPDCTSCTSTLIFDSFQSRPHFWQRPITAPTDIFHKLFPQTISKPKEPLHKLFPQTISKSPRLQPLHKLFPQTIFRRDKVSCRQPPINLVLRLFIDPFFGVPEVQSNRQHMPCCRRPSAHDRDLFWFVWTDWHLRCRQPWMKIIQSFNRPPCHNSIFTAIAINFYSSTLPRISFLDHGVASTTLSVECWCSAQCG